MNIKHKYLVVMQKDFCIIAINEEHAEKIAIEMCADDPDALLPCNMEIMVNKSKLPNSYFDSPIKCIECNKDMPDNETGYCYECNEHLTKTI